MQELPQEEKMKIQKNVSQTKKSLKFVNLKKQNPNSSHNEIMNFTEL